VRFINVEDAIRTLENPSVSREIHEEALHYLASLDHCLRADGLVHALQSDDFGIRWEASIELTRLIPDSITAVLKALMDPDQVCNPRLRRGVVRMIENIHDPVIKDDFLPLLDALKGPAADITSMWEAYQLSLKIDPGACKDFDLEKYKQIKSKGINKISKD
jgi:HEAT repeat protein